MFPSLGRSSQAQGRSSQAEDLHAATGVVRVKAWAPAKKGHFFSGATTGVMFSDCLKSAFRVSIGGFKTGSGKGCA